MLYFALYIVTWVDEDARRARPAAKRLEEEAEGRGGKGGKALGELEDELRAGLNRTTDELNAALAETHAGLEGERTQRTQDLVVASQETEAAIAALGGKEATAAIVFAPTGEVVVAEGARRPGCASRPEEGSPRDEIERVNTELQEREAGEDAATQQRIEDSGSRSTPGWRRSASGSAARPRASRRRSGSARDEIERLQPMHWCPRRRSTAGTSATWTASTAPGSAAAPASSGPAWAPRRSARSSSGWTSTSCRASLHSEVRTTSGQRRKKAIKQLRVVEAFRRSGNRPSG